MRSKTGILSPETGERDDTLGETIGNSVTHGIGALLSAAGFAVLVINASERGPAIRILAYSLFGASLVLLYTMSTLYHALAAPRAKRVLEILDHASIYVLIAGSYSAFTLGVIGGTLGWAIFGIEWTLATVGIILKLVFFDRFPRISLFFYLAMGWVIVVAWQAIRASFTAEAIGFLIAGGLCYSVGTVFYALKKVPWFHPIWHLFVLAGSICHFFAAILAI